MFAFSHVVRSAKHYIYIVGFVYFIFGFIVLHRWNQRENGEHNKQTCQAKKDLVRSIFVV